MGRRLPIWFAEHKNDPKIKELIARRELWFLPIQNLGRLRLHVHLRHSAPPGHVRLPRPHRRRQPLLAQDAARQQQQRRSTATARTASTRTATTRPSAASTRRARATPSAARPTAARTRCRSPRTSRVDRLQRRVKFDGQHQLPLRRPAAADAGLLHDRLRAAGRDDLRRHHRHRRRRAPSSRTAAALVGPLRVQRRHDRQRLHELRHHRLDAGDGHVRHAAASRRLQPVRVPGRRGQGRGRLREEPRVRAQRRELAAEPRPPEELRQRPEPLPGQADRRTSSPTASTSPTARTQIVEAIVRKALGPSDVTRQRRRRRTARVDDPDDGRPRGRALRRGPGLLLRAPPRDDPRRRSAPARVAAGDVVNVVVQAGGQQQEFRYRVEARRSQDATKKRVLVVAAEDYTGVSPNVTPGLRHRAALPAQHVKPRSRRAGYEVETFNIDAPPANGGTPNGVVDPQIKYPTYLGVLSHFDAVDYYTGDDFVPQDIDRAPTRAASTHAPRRRPARRRWRRGRTT